MANKYIPTPKGGQAITRSKDKLNVPDHPIIPCIRGDGTGVDITPVMIKVVDAAVQKAYGGVKKIEWLKVLAGDEAIQVNFPGMTEAEIVAIAPDERQKLYLPDETVEAIRKYLVAIKGPLTTPVGGGIRSLNVTLRILLDLYACVRPVQHIGTPAPVKRPEDVDIVLFRENTEDVYCGIGVKPISKEGSQRLIRAAIEYAIANNRKLVTLVHKGNIMKFTEGAFRDWGYELAKEYPQLITEDEVTKNHGGKVPAGKILINDRIADQFFQQMLLRPSEYSVAATMNLNGDYISDAAAAQVGGLGVAPGANINYLTGHAVFEATHGTAPKHAGQDKVNPGSIILSAVEMLRYMGWQPAADLVMKGVKSALDAKKVTYDLERQMEGATLLSCSAFGDEIIKRM